MEVVNKIGRRKTSVARLYLSSGSGNISINGRTLEDYFPSEIHKIIIKQPLVLVDSDGKF
ncbi:MAG: 30S ribosomal protein S9, partial [Cytophagales bacterium]|nr:30S ribosomal protein S9 [Cytophagales bacterium]